MKKIACIGLGNMGAALVRGLINSKKVDPPNLAIHDVDSHKMNELSSELHLRTAHSIPDAIDSVDCIILAVKPQIMSSVLSSISNHIDDVLVISIAAGLPTSFYLKQIGKPFRIIRTMPNAAAMINASATALCRAGTATDEDLQYAGDLFSALGSVSYVDEKMMNAVTGLSGSGPGYLFIIMEAFSDAGVLMGLDRATARMLTVQTFLGAAQMAASGDAFSTLKDRITSPGGTTISGIKVLEEAGIRGIIMDAVKKAAKRSADLES